MKLRFAASALAFSLAALCAPAQAALYLDLEETDLGVEAALSGSFDFDALPRASSGDLGDILGIGRIGVRVTLRERTVRFALDSDRPYGLSGTIEALSQSGESFGQAGTGRRGIGFDVPETLDNPLRLDGAFSLTGATYAMLGLTEGSVVVDEFCSFDEIYIRTVVIPPDMPDMLPVPLPPSVALLLAALGGLGLVARRAHSASAA